MQLSVGKNLEGVRAAIVPTSLGSMLVAATDAGICALEFGESESELKRRMRQQFPNAVTDEFHRFDELICKAVDVVEGRIDASSLPLDPGGTDFQREVWSALRAIPAGTTISYSDLAVKVGNPKATRAVATACATNPVAVAIPCHRVVRRDGGLGGYRWGLARKRALLDQERTVVTCE